MYSKIFKCFYFKNSILYYFLILTLNHFSYFFNKTILLWSKEIIKLKNKTIAMLLLLLKLHIIFTYNIEIFKNKKKDLKILILINLKRNNVFLCKRFALRNK